MKLSERNIRRIRENPWCLEHRLVKAVQDGNLHRKNVIAVALELAVGVICDADC